MKDTEPAGAIVSTNQIFDKLLDLEKVVTPLPAQVADHEIRIRTVEIAMWKLIGFTLAAGALITGLQVWYYLSHLTK
jgi:hypothetical protein